MNERIFLEKSPLVQPRPVRGRRIPSQKVVIVARMHRNGQVADNTTPRHPSRRDGTCRTADRNRTTSHVWRIRNREKEDVERSATIVILHLLGIFQRDLEVQVDCSIAVFHHKMRFRNRKFSQKLKKLEPDTHAKTKETVKHVLFLRTWRNSLEADHKCRRGILGVLGPGHRNLCWFHALLHTANIVIKVFACVGNLRRPFVCLAISMTAPDINDILIFYLQTRSFPF